MMANENPYVEPLIGILNKISKKYHSGSYQAPDGTTLDTGQVICYIELGPDWSNKVSTGTEPSPRSLEVAEEFLKELPEGWEAL